VGIYVSLDGDIARSGVATEEASVSFCSAYCLHLRPRGQLANLIERLLAAQEIGVWTSKAYLLSV
jgi:hypothetical protein